MLKFKDYLRLAIDKKWLTRIFTILLSGIAFACFALSSVAFTNNEYEMYIDAVLSYKKDYISIINGGGGNLSGTSNLSQEVIDLFEGIEEIQENGGYLYCYYGSGSKISSFLGGGSSGRLIPYLTEYLPRNLSEGERLVYDKTLICDFVCGNFEAYDGEFYSVLAGRYPENKTEIAISDAQYELFKAFGYQDITDALYYDNGGKVKIEESLKGEVYEINDYADMVGKQLNFCDETLSKVTIVGVIDTGFDLNEIYMGSMAEHIERKIFLSGDWREQLKGNDEICVGMITRKVTTRSLAKKLVDATLEAQKLGYIRGQKIFEETGNGVIDEIWQKVNMGMYPIYNLYESVEVQQNVIFLLDGIALVFGIFGFVLNFYLIGASIKRKERKIGILRAMGASDKLVTKIFLTEALLMAVLIFAFALIVTVCGYYFVLEQLFFYSHENVAVQLLSFKFVNYLILAACCFVIPLLAALIPIKRFFKKPIVSNIRGK